MKQYFISKKKYKGEVVFIDCEKSNVYKLSPKNSYPYEGIKVNELIIIKPSLIEKIIKRKIKNKISLFLSFLIDNLDGNNSDDDTRKALGDLQRYRKFVNQKYSIYLDEKYMSLLNKKINVIERELKNSVLFSQISQEEKTNNRKR